MTDATHPIDEIAAHLDKAAQNKRAVVKITEAHPTLDMESAYDVQRASMARRVERGEQIIGMKMGLTSRAKMTQMSVHEPIYGHLTDAMMGADGDTLSMDDFIHPRVEPEIAFILSRDLRGPVTPAQAMLAVEGVCAAIEVIDSRFEKFKFTLVDVVADNASSVKFALGSTVRPPSEIDISNLGMVMEINGDAVQIGSSAAIYDHPARSLATLANMLARRGESIPAGSVVLAGGATAAEFVKEGDVVRLRADQLGEVTLRITA